MGWTFDCVADSIAYVCVRIAFGLFVVMLLGALPILALLASVSWIYEKLFKLTR
jgi:hypothetical protein